MYPLAIVFKTFLALLLLVRGDDIVGYSSFGMRLKTKKHVKKKKKEPLFPLTNLFKRGITEQEEKQSKKKKTKQKQKKELWTKRDVRDWLTSLETISAKTIGLLYEERVDGEYLLEEVKHGFEKLEKVIPSKEKMELLLWICKNVDSRICDTEQKKSTRKVVVATSKGGVTASKSKSKTRPKTGGGLLPSPERTNKRPLERLQLKDKNERKEEVRSKVSNIGIGGAGA
ncbi:hypothetical protein RFI_20861, partial [Reticulomyxa filosa]